MAKLRKEHEVAADAAEMEMEVEVALTNNAASASDMTSSERCEGGF